MDNGLGSFPMTRCPLKIGVFCDAIVDIPDARHAVAGIRDRVIRALRPRKFWISRRFYQVLFSSCLDLNLGS
ncbi:hypothetical protein E2C01_048428 [Portunus trituberculatus]|uniref:Uncharacterized protein n=1 Tax=Portunus trituberculatus TaxID=210409 RepID=A0A5B7GBK5_PORTR|nr:hypothetical protein [Portunus trituberculatus]